MEGRGLVVMVRCDRCGRSVRVAEVIYADEFCDECAHEPLCMPCVLVHLHELEMEGCWRGR